MDILIENEHVLVLPYDEKGENLARVLATKFFTAKDLINLPNKHYVYFKEFFGDPKKQNNYGHHATIIVKEKKYLSKSYLDDYQAHYVLTHTVYNKYCERVHFFSFDYKKAGYAKFELEEFYKEYKNFDSENKENPFWDSYLGYIVVRELPKGLIGATVLKGYENDPKRKYTAVRNYSVNLWGIERRIKSLVYIEQDSVVGACSTSALFSAFHKVSYMFQRELPFPNKITRSAGISFTEPTRLIPNRDGMEAGQIVKAIDSLGLAAEYRSPYATNQQVMKFDILYIKAYLYAYCRMGIPIIVGLDFDKKGLHAVTINGYREVDYDEINKSFDADKTPNKLKNLIQWAFSKLKLKATKTGDNSNPLNLRSFFIDRFYAHDDQVGPFSRIGFGQELEIVTSWWKGSNTADKVSANLYAMIVPLEDIIRIHFESVVKVITRIDFWLGVKLQNEEISWDIYIDYSNDYKNRLKESKTNPSLLEKVLFASLPKYIWVAEFYIRDLKMFDIVMDSAEINENFFAVDIVFYHNSFREIIKTKFFSRDDRLSVEEDLSWIDIEHLNLFRTACGIKKVSEELATIS